MGSIPTGSEMRNKSLRLFAWVELIKFLKDWKIIVFVPNKDFQVSYYSTIVRNNKYLRLECDMKNGVRKRKL